LYLRIAGGDRRDAAHGCHLYKARPSLQGPRYAGTAPASQLALCFQNEGPNRGGVCWLCLCLAGHSRKVLPRDLEASSEKIPTWPKLFHSADVRWYQSERNYVAG